MQQLLCSASATSQVTKEKPRFACKRPPKDVRDKIEQILLKSSTDILNFVPLLLALSEYTDIQQAAADFQETLAQVLAKEVIRASERENIQKVCLSGGCCLNSLLTQRLRELLERHELQVYEGLKVPPNDGGVSLGQAWVVLMRLHSTAKE